MKLAFYGNEDFFQSAKIALDNYVTRQRMNSRGEG